MIPHGNMYTHKQPMTASSMLLLAGDPQMVVLVYKVALYATKFLARFKPSLAYSEKFDDRSLV